MALSLVNYSDSSSDEEIEEQMVKSTPKSKLPNPFGKTNPTNDNEGGEENSAEHNGRTRLFPHERGNWATYVYIHCPKTESLINLQDSVLNLIQSTNSLETVQFHAIDELHLSLTRTVILHHHWIDEFVRSIENHIKNTNRFWIQFDSIKIYCNENQTRTFLSLTLTESSSPIKQNLCQIVRQLDSCLDEFKLAPFYKEASFHVSLLWCLGDRRKELQPLLPQFCSFLEHLSVADNSNFAIFVEQLFCKIGNKLYNFHL